MRKSCLDCARKHIAQAIILLEESLLGYPCHFWLSIGHLSEASSEILKDHPEIAKIIRERKLALIESRNEQGNIKYDIDLMEIIIMLELLEIKETDNENK